MDFEIDGKPYEFASNYTWGDTVVIRKASGLAMQEFAELMQEHLEAAEAAKAARAAGQEPLEFGMDEQLLVAMIAVAISRQHRSWPAERVARYMADLDLDRVKGPERAPDADEEDEEEDAVPPAEGHRAPDGSDVRAADGQSSSSASSSEPDSPSDAPIPIPPGSPASTEPAQD